MGSSKKVDFAEGLLVFREQMGIRTNGNLSQFSLLTCVQMGSHLFAKVLYVGPSWNHVFAKGAPGNEFDL